MTPQAASADFRCPAFTRLASHISVHWKNLTYRMSAHKVLKFITSRAGQKQYWRQYRALSLCFWWYSSLPVWVEDTFSAPPERSSTQIMHSKSHWRACLMALLLLLSAIYELANQYSSASCWLMARYASAPLPCFTLGFFTATINQSLVALIVVPVIALLVAHAVAYVLHRPPCRLDCLVACCSLCVAIAI